MNWFECIGLIVLSNCMFFKSFCYKKIKINMEKPLTLIYRFKLTSLHAYTVKPFNAQQLS